MRAMRHSAGWIAGLTLASVVAVVAWSYGSGGLVAVMLSPDIEGAAKVQTIQEFFLAWGSAAPLIYMAVVIVEVVVAPIPGTMVYLPGDLCSAGRSAAWWRCLATWLALVSVA